MTFVLRYLGIHISLWDKILPRCVFKWEPNEPFPRNCPQSAGRLPWLLNPSSSDSMANLALRATCNLFSVHLFKYSFLIL